MAPRRFNPSTFFSEPGTGKNLLQFRNKQVIYSQGDPGSALFYLAKGRAKLVVMSPHGKEAVVGLLGPGDFFGQEALNGHPGRLATAVAMSACQATQIEKATVTRLLHQDHGFSDMFVAHLLTNIVRVQEDLVDQLFSSSEKRLARMLLLLARFGKKGKPETFLAPRITHQVLAEMVGTTRARISFFMNKFRDLGFIECNGELRINQSLLNVVLHD